MSNSKINNLDITNAKRPKTKDIVVAMINGEFTVKRMYRKNNKIYLNPGNTDYQSIYITDDMDFQIWGVVTHTIHHCR